MGNFSNVSFDDHLKELINSEFTKTEEQKTQDQARKIRIPLGDKEVEFNDEKDLASQLNSTFGQIQQYVANLRSEVEQLKAQQTNVVRTDEDIVTQTPPNTFDTKKYIQLMGEDPIKAQDYMDSYRYFEGKIEKPSQFIRDQLAEAAQLRQIVDVYRFKESNPEFPGGQAGDVLNKVREAMGLPLNYQGLEAAYSIARDKGILPNYKQIAFAQQQMMQQQQQVQQGYPQNVPQNFGVNQQGQNSYIPTVPRRS